MGKMFFSNTALDRFAAFSLESPSFFENSMAHKKAAGSTNNGRDSRSKRLGVKKFGGQTVIAGNIIIRQRGNKYYAGNNVSTGKDFTLFATADGVVHFTQKRRPKFNGQRHVDVFVHVEEHQAKKKAA